MKKFILVVGFIFALAPLAFADIGFGANIRVDDDAAGTQFYPSLAVDTYGNIYVAWYDNRNGNYDIYFAKSTNGGASFGSNVRVDDSVAGGQYSPSIAVDTTGNIYVAWHDNRNGNNDIYFAKSTDGGANFGTNIRVNDGAADDQDMPSIAVDTTGNIYVAWHDRRNGNWDIYFAKSTNGGASFGANIRVDDSIAATSQLYSSLAIDTAGNIYVAWHDFRNDLNPDIYFAKSTDGGASFGANIRVDDTGTSTSTQGQPSITIDTTGNIYVAWNDSRNGSFDIYFAKSTNGGASFGSNVRVDDSVAGGQYSPSIAVDTNGDIDITWQDDRNGNADIYFSQSTNGGASFGTNIRVDDSTTGGQSSPSLAIDTTGNIYVAWQDDRNGNADIYFAKGVYIPPNVPPVANAGEDQVASVGDVVTLDGSASYDPDGTIVSYTWKSLSDYGNTVIGTGQTSQVMARGYAEELIQLTVTDNDGASSSDTMVILNSRVNLLPPVMASIGNKSVLANQSLSFQVQATDPEGFNMEYSALNLPSGASFNPNTRTFNWKPTPSQVGQHIVGFQVNDGFFNDNEDVTITVGRKPLPPPPDIKME